MSQYTDIVPIDGIDNSRIVEDIHISSEVISNINELVKSNTLILDETHVEY